MQTEPTPDLPAAYALALWLRDLAATPAQIAGVLDVAPEAVAQLLRLAELKRSRVAPSNGARGPRGVAVFVEGADADLVEDAAALAGLRGGTLHLLARPRSRAGSEALWIATARRVLEIAVVVNPVAAAGARSALLRALIAERGPVTVLSNRFEA
jgi:hypothetical protein